MFVLFSQITMCHHHPKNAARFVEAVESTKTATLQLVFTPPSWHLLIIDDDEMEALDADLNLLQPNSLQRQ